MDCFVLPVKGDLNGDMEGKHCRRGAVSLGMALGVVNVRATSGDTFGRIGAVCLIRGSRSRSE